MIDQNWLTIPEAQAQFGYSVNDTLTRRLRQLRGRGLVIDLGNPPKTYPVTEDDVDTTEKVVVYWINTRTALIRANAPPELLNAKKGKRPKQKP